MRRIIFVLFICCCSLCAANARSAETNFAQGSVSITQGKGKLDVTIDGHLFTSYIYKGYSRPILYPLFGPGQLPMTRHWPMEDAPNEEHDHVHHRSVWFEHGSLNNVDFWSETTNAGKTLHVKFLQIRSGRTMGLIQSTNLLVDSSNKPIASDVRTLRFYNTPKGKFFDYEITTYAAFGPLTFGDTKEGTMAIRIAESMRLVRNKHRADGHIVLSTGVRDGKTWGKRADWCDYYGPVENQIVGIAVFDNPANPRHPTWWHVRDYGLLAANPFGIHFFEKKPPGAGELNVPAGKSITFKYRVYLHKGDTESANVAEKYREYAEGRRPSS